MASKLTSGASFICFGNDSNPLPAPWFTFVHTSIYLLFFEEHHVLSNLLRPSFDYRHSIQKSTIDNNYYLNTDEE